MKFYNHMAKWHLYFDRFPDEPNKEEQIISNLLSHIEKRLNISTILMQRLINYDEQLLDASENYPPRSIGRIKPFIEYFSDLESYINSAHKFFKLCHKLNTLLKNERLNSVLEKHKTLIETYRNTRNALEHIDERILSDDDFVKEIRSISENILQTKHGDIPIKQDALKPLYYIYEEVLNVIKELYIIPRQDWYDAVFGEWDKKLEEHWKKISQGE